MFAHFVASSVDAVLKLVRPSVRVVPVVGFPGDQSEPCDESDVWQPNVSRVTAIVSGRNHQLALDHSGSVLAWGENSLGQLGDGSRIDRADPVPVPQTQGRGVAIAAGDSHSLALCRDGSVLAWGSNQNGQLGDGTTEDRTAPVTVVGLTAPGVAIAAGGSSSFVLTSENRVLAWGFNGGGELADGTTHDRHVPTPMTPIPGTVIAFGLGWALGSGRTLYTWGFNGRGQLGAGNTAPSAIPLAVTSAQALRAVAGGGAHRLALQADSSVLGWGWNHYGQLGDGTTADRSLPAPVEGVADGIEAVAAGYGHSLALRSDGSVLAWGWNESGQLGDGTRTDRGRPVSVRGVSGVTAIAAGYDSSLALGRDGTVACWGRRIPVRDNTPSLASTRLGGCPDLAPGVVWPRFRGVPQSFVAQINLADISPHDDEHLLPTEGLLSFFYDSTHSVSGRAPSDSGGWAVIFTAAGTPLVAHDFPPDLPSNGRHRTLELEARWELTFPPPAVIDSPFGDLSAEESEAFYELAVERSPNGPRHRSLGYEDPIQGSHVQAIECELASRGVDVHKDGYPDPLPEAVEAGIRDWRLLLQVDSDDTAGMHWNDAGRLYYWIRVSDLTEGRFDRVWLIQESY